MKPEVAVGFTHYQIAHVNGRHWIAGPLVKRHTTTRSEKALRFHTRSGAERHRRGLCDSVNWYVVGIGVLP